MSDVGSGIEVNKVFRNGVEIDSVGVCPHCKDVVEYKSVCNGLLNGYMPGTGFRFHKGVCCGCKTEFQVCKNS